MSNPVEAIYRQHRFAVFRRCMSLLRDESDARDATHEVFLRLIGKPGGFQGRSALGTFLYAVATHECLNRLRTRTLRDQDWEAAAGHHLDLHAQTSDLASTTAARQQLARVFEEPNERTALIGFYFFVDGLTQEEIAKLVGLSRVSVNQHVQRFRASAKAKEDG